MLVLSVDKVLLIAASVGMYYLTLERNEYKASWRVHVFGLLLPMIIISRTDDALTQSIALSFALVHLYSICFPPTRLNGLEHR